MANETVRLAEYAVGLRYDGLPPEVIQRAKDSIADTVALANGTLAHAFESDNLTRPGDGVHPHATLLPLGLAIAQEHGNSGR